MTVEQELSDVASANRRQLGRVVSNFKLLSGKFENPCTNTKLSISARSNSGSFLRGHRFHAALLSLLPCASSDGETDGQIGHARRRRLQLPFRRLRRLTRFGSEQKEEEADHFCAAPVQWGPAGAGGCALLASAFAQQ